LAFDCWFDALVWQAAQSGADGRVGFGDVTAGGHRRDVIHGFWISGPLQVAVRRIRTCVGSVAYGSLMMASPTCSTLHQPHNV
jgi:hypothetical protein